MDYRAEFIKMLKSMSGKYSSYQVFSDWVEMAALAYRNSCHVVHDERWHKYEKQYMGIAAKYGPEELDKFCRMITLIAQSLEEEMEDVLGRIFMEAGLGDAGTGQFFTPFNVSMMSAKLILDEKGIPEEGKIRLHEPACGAGGMVIAACRILHERGFDYQRRLDVVAQDLDWRSVYMTYFQLSLIGCRAFVVQGNTLTDPFHLGFDRDRCLETPAMMGLIV